MEFLKLSGILIILIGFYFKFDVLAVVVIASIVTGLAANMSFTTILETLGQSFINTRLMSIFFLSFVVIAILERYGLKERSSSLILNIKNSTASKILGLYTAIRLAAAALSLRLGGHVQFIRPLIYPMAYAAAENSKKTSLTEKEDEDLKAISAAVENYGNFFGQNIFVGSSGVLLIKQTLEAAGYYATPTQIALYSIPIGVITIIYSIIQVHFYNKDLLKGGVK